MTNEENSASHWKQKAEELRHLYDNLSMKAGSLPEAARADFEAKLDHGNIMITALERDVAELEKEAGADRETVEELYAKTSEAVSNLRYELDALATGNPTTVSAAIDATAKVVEKSGEAIKNITSKIPTLSKD